MQITPVFGCTIVLLLALTVQARTQENISDGDSTSFDFWLGTWSLSWKDNDSIPAHGENTITKTLDGKVIQEQFRGLTGINAGFKGMSVSVFTALDEKWHQTWVDNQQGYLDFVGGTIGKKRFFSRQFIGSKGEIVHQRMVFYNIEYNTFDWDWENSTDGGTTWNLLWRIHYQRKKA